MQNVVAPIRAVLSRILFLGLSAQIVLGLLWMGGNARSFLCLLTLPAALVAGYCMMKAVGIRVLFWQVWGSMALLTFPMAMQCHVLQAVDSLGYSCFLVMLAGVIEILRGESAFHIRHLIGIHFFWLLASLFLPEYFWFGLIPVAAVFLQRLRKLYRARKIGVDKSGERGKLWRHLLITVAFAGLILSFGRLLEAGDLREEPRTDLRSAWFRRAAWSNLADDYQYWPKEIQNALTQEELGEVIKAPEKMEAFFQPRLEELLGEEWAKEWYGAFAGDTFGRNYRLILSQIKTDLLSYAFPPIAVQQVLAGRGYSSLCFRNYEQMQQTRPMLTGTYVSYGAWWLAVGLVFTVVTQILYIVRRKPGKDSEPEQKNPWAAVFVCIVTAGVIVGWYTLQQAGLWNYTKGLPVGTFWMLWMILMTVKISGEKQDG